MTIRQAIENTVAAILFAVGLGLLTSMCGCFELTYSRWRDNCVLAYAYDEPSTQACIADAKEAYRNGATTFTVPDPRYYEIDGGSNAKP